MAYGAEESYYRPRLRGTDDILSIMSAATSQGVDTINRTGDSLARSYGERPRIIGDAVEGFMRGQRDLEERERRRGLEDLRKKAIEQDVERGKLDLDRLKSEEDWYNTSYGPAGGMGPVLPGKGMTRRDVQREQGMRAGELGLTQSEENIASSKAQRENAAKALELQLKQINASAGMNAANNARQEQLFQEQMRTLKEGRAAEEINALLLQNPNLTTLGTDQAGPPGQLDAVGGKYGVDPGRLNTLAQQQRATIAANARQQSMIDTTMNPLIAPVTRKLGELESSLGGIAQLANSVKTLDAVPFEKMSGNDYANQVEAVRTSLRIADPQMGDRMAQQIGGANIQPIKGFFEGEKFFEGPATQGKKAAMQLITQKRAEAVQLIAEARNTGNKQLIEKAEALLGGIQNAENILKAGGDPQRHNQFQPVAPQGPQNNMFQPRQQPQPVKYDGRG